MSGFIPGLLIEKLLSLVGRVFHTESNIVCYAAISTVNALPMRTPHTFCHTVESE